MKISQGGFREQMGGPLGGAVQHEFDHQMAIINTWSNEEHHDDGTHADVTTDTLTNVGQTDLGGPWLVPDANILTPLAFTANVNNFRVEGLDTAIILRLSTDASRNLTGIFPALARRTRWILLANVGTHDLVLKHESASSTAAYRISCPGSVDLTLNSADSVWLFYDAIEPTTARWRVIGV